MFFLKSQDFILIRKEKTNSGPWLRAKDCKLLLINVGVNTHTLTVNIILD